MNETNHKLLQKLGLTEAEMKFYDTYNPHNLFCRLRELNVPLDTAKDIMAYYDDTFYRPLTKFLQDFKQESKVMGIDCEFYDRV